MARDASSQVGRKTTGKASRKPRATSAGLVIAGVPRVNLLPPSELERRAAGALVRRWIAALVATAVAVSALVVTAHWVRAAAVVDLATEQARTMDLNTELAGLSPVSQALAERTALTNLRADALGNDLIWRALFADLTSTVPSGAELTAFDLITGANPVPDADPTTGIGLIGRLTVHTEDAADQNRMVDRLRSLDIALTADAGSLSSAGEEGFTFVVEVVLDQSHYSGDHLVGGVR